MTLTADLGWIRTEKDKAKGVQSSLASPSLKRLAINFPFPTVKISRRTLGSTWPRALERPPRRGAWEIDTVAWDTGKGPCHRQPSAGALRDPRSPPPAQQLSRDPLYSPGTRRWPPAAGTAPSPAPSQRRAEWGAQPWVPTTGTEVELGKTAMVWGGGIQIIRLLLPGRISQRNLTRGLQPHQAAASTVVTATLFSLPSRLCSVTTVSKTHSTQPREHHGALTREHTEVRGSPSCSRGSGSPNPAPGCAFSRLRSQTDGTEEGGICQQVPRGREESPGAGMPALLCPSRSTEPRYSPEGKPGQRGQQRRAGGRSPLSATLGPCKATLSPQNFAFAASIPHDAAKPLPRSKASSPGAHGTAFLGG